MKLRDYQGDIFEQLTTSCSNDLVQLDTGAGKTPIEAALAQWAPYALLVAHRNILIQQISEKLAAFGLEHDTISTEHTRRRCIAAHRAHGRSYIQRAHGARLVASMQSIVAAIRHRRFNVDTSLPWLIVIDEAHHVVSDNMWGQLRTLFPNARIVGFTATPARMDGESLHVDKGGLFDRLVHASMLGNDSARALIERGYLSDFKVYAASRWDLMSTYARKIEEDPEFAMAMYDSTGVAYVAPGHCVRRGRVAPLDYLTCQLTLRGDPITEYKRLALGRRAIMMCPAIKNAETFAALYREAHIPAACINSTQSPGEIARILDGFRTGSIWVLTNVDMVGEGFDLPACEVLIIATRTASFPRYRQWCGRVLRPADGKDMAIIIDHAGMCASHGLPDEPVEWDLLNPPCGPQERKQVPCDDCGRFFLFKLESCPDCGWDNAWLDRPAGFSPGSYEFDIRMIDQALVGITRRERRERADNERARTELNVSRAFFGADLVGKTLAAVAAWFPRRLVDGGVPIIEINAFQRSAAAHDRNFWIRNFTVADIKTDSCAKALKVYRQWLKSQSSTATRPTTGVRAISS